MGNTIEIRIRTVMWAATSALLAVTATLIVTSAWSADAAPGDLDSTYVPTPGCRAFDYRPAPNQVGPKPTPLGAGEAYTQQITGNVGDCVGPLAIPADAVAVAMNVTAVGATAQTNLRLYPADLTDVPTLSNLNVTAGQAPFPNKVDVTLSPGGAIKIFNQNGSVFVIGDIVGYYTKSSLVDIEARLSAVEALASANEGNVAVVGSSLPFSTTKYAGNGNQPLTATPQAFVTTDPITAPVDGTVTIVYSTLVSSIDPGWIAVCAPDTTASDWPAANSISFVPGLTRFESPGINGDTSTLAGTAVFDITAGDSIAYAVYCEQSVIGSGAIRSMTVTAIFTPDP